MKEAQQAGAKIALQQVEETQRQAVPDEWAARCRSSTVRNTGGYLFGIIQTAIRGELKAWASQTVHENAPPSLPSPGEGISAPSTREVALQHIAKLRDKLPS